MKMLALTLVSLLAAGAAVAQPAPPPPSPLAPPPPPPPSRGASVHVDRGPDRALRFDLHCAEADTTRACADIALELLSKLNGDVQPK